MWLGGQPKVPLTVAKDLVVTVPRKSRKIISQEESEYHFWSRIPDYADAEVYDDFLRKSPSGTYHLVAFALLKAKLGADGRRLRSLVSRNQHLR